MNLCVCFTFTQCTLIFKNTFTINCAVSCEYCCIALLITYPLLYVYVRDLQLLYLPLFFVEKIHSFLNFRNNCQVCTKKTFYFALFLCQEVCFFLVKKYLSGCIINLCCFSEVPSACLIWLFFWHCHVPESTFSHFFTSVSE